MRHLWVVLLPAAWLIVGWTWRARRGAAHPNWTWEYLRVRDLPQSIRAAFSAQRTFRCGFDVRRPKSMVVSGPVGRCVVANDAIACQFARMTFVVVNRENAQIVVRRGKLITERVDVTDGVNEVWITPYDWDAARQLLEEAGWPLPEPAS